MSQVGAAKFRKDSWSEGGEGLRGNEVIQKWSLRDLAPSFDEEVGELQAPHDKIPLPWDESGCLSLPLSLSGLVVEVLSS